MLQSSNGLVKNQQFGLDIDYAVPGDYDGDGKTDFAVWRGVTITDGWWYWLRSSDGQISGVKFGLGDTDGDLPAPGDYDGDGKTDPAIFRRAGALNQSQFWILGSSMGLRVVPWGIGLDYPLVAFNTVRGSPNIPFAESSKAGKKQKLK